MCKARYLPVGNYVFLSETLMFFKHLSNPSKTCIFSRITFYEYDFFRSIDKNFISFFFVCLHYQIFKCLKMSKDNAELQFVD